MRLKICARRVINWVIQDVERFAQDSAEASYLVGPRFSGIDTWRDRNRQHEGAISCEPDFS